LATVRVGLSAVASVVLTLTVSSPGLTAALRSRLQSQSVACSDAATASVASPAVRDVDAMDVEGGAAPAVTLTGERRSGLRIDWQTAYNSVDVFGSLLSIVCNL
jgi:hypothetical protein